MKKDHSYWETCHAPSDEAVGALMERFIVETISPKTIFQKLKKINKDFHPHCDIAGETIFKVIDFMKSNSIIEESEILKAYDEVQEEAYREFDEELKKHSI